MSMYVRWTFALVALLFAHSALAQEAKVPLDHDAYDVWNRLGSRAIASDGRWVLYEYGPDQGDGTLRVQGTAGGPVYTFDRGAGARFARDASHVAFLIKPAEDSLKAARKAKKKDHEMPQDTLAILDLATGEVTRIPRVQSFQMPEEAGGLLAWHLELEPVEADTTVSDEGGDEKDSASDKGHGTLVLHSFVTGRALELPHARAYHFSEEGRYLAVAAAPPDSMRHGVLLIDTDAWQVDTLMAGKGDYEQLTFDKGEAQLAFISDRDDQAADDPAGRIYRWHGGTLDTLVTPDTPGIAEGWWVGSGASLAFSESGRRLFFGTQPRPEDEDSDDEDEDEDEVKLDIWHWKDPLLQPMQLEQLEQERNRSYRAVVHLAQGRVVQLAREDMPTVEVGDKGDADFALANTNMPYRQEISWDSPRFMDVYRVDVTDGSRELLAERIQDTADFSPDAKFVSWWDRNALAWMVVPATGGEVVNVSAALPYRVDNENHDWPYRPSSYGYAGWTADDEAFLVYDKHDIWALDPSAKREPYSVTNGYGRQNNLRFRYRRLDPDEDFVADPLLLSAFDYGTKENGFYAGDLAEDGAAPKELVMGAYSYGFPRQAEDAGKLLVTRERFEEFGDLWVAEDDFSDMERISDLNPQQSEYLWGTAELVSWTSLDGVPLDGMLFKPEGFDPSAQYPMMVYFYEKMSSGLYWHRPPAAGGSSISVSFYVSRGYLVFIPDIPYKVGYPGESALNAVMSGVTMLINQGFVQADNVGVQGHSWGGYQIAYMVTETNLFKAAEAGAPVSNMTSAYGGIRWGSGMSRMFQYERTQSRIGGSLWEVPLRYIDNSPLFQADKVETPVLMMHNDDDGAVPWYQGIEFFVALRRLGKPVWMLNYNGAGHGLRTFANRKDWTIRMQQFFDHYLKGAPAPVWMEHGVPALMKGKTLGLELVGDQR